MLLPFEQVSWTERIRAEFEEAAELPRGCGGPEGEFLHEGGGAGGYEGFELLFEGGVVWVGGDGMKGGVVAMVALVFPDVDCGAGWGGLVGDGYRKRGGWKRGGERRGTKCIAVTDFRPPAAHEVNVVFFHAGHARVPRSDEIDVLVDFVGLDVVEDYRVDVFASCQDLRK